MDVDNTIDAIECILEPLYIHMFLQTKTYYFWSIAVKANNTMNQSEIETEECNRCLALENIQPVLSAGKHTADAKRGKTCNWCQARETYSGCRARENDVQQLPNDGKHTNDAKRGKTCNRCQAGETCSRCQVPENVQPVPSAGKHTTDAERVKILQPVPIEGKTCDQGEYDIYPPRCN